MKFRIEWARMKADPLHAVWVVGYCILGFIILQWIDSLLVTKELTRDRFMTFAPYIRAGGMLIGQALNRFSGESIIHSWDLRHTLLLLSTISTYIIAPSLFVWGLRARARWGQESVIKRFPFTIILALGLSGPFILSMATISIVGPIRSGSAYASLQQAQTVGANKDALIGDVNILVLKAQSFYHVPVSEGGGGGRWMNIKGRSPSTLSIQDIEEPEPVLGRVYAPLFPQQKSKFLLEVFREDSLQIWGIGREMGEKETFVNKDGQKGKHQVSLIVTPKQFFFRLEN